MDPSYQEILQLLKKAQRLGLNFDIGNAYISRAYIEEQDNLNAQIDSITLSANIEILEPKP
jgi:hypothetical protein